MKAKDDITPGSTHTLHVDAAYHGTRLDVYLATLFTAYSRSFLKDLIACSSVQLNAKRAVKSGTALKEGDSITITFPQKAIPTTAEIMVHAQGIEIIYTHEHFLIINKPAGLIMHHAHSTAGKPTLVDWLILHEASIARVGSIDRPGIVHRLDKNTSGLLIIARTNYAHAQFTKLFQERAIHKTYHALMQGHPPAAGTIDLPIGRNQVHKHKMASFSGETHHKQRDAMTHYRVLDYFDSYSRVELKPITGRTHQIRVHCAAIGHPLLGDTTYNSNPLKTPLDRHALHAYALSFTFDGTSFSFQSPLPADMEALISTPFKTASQHKTD